jgi:hypothetical protein
MWDVKILWVVAPVAFAAVWVAICLYLSSKTRKVVWEDKNTFPTVWSDTFGWLAPIGGCIILGIALVKAIMRLPA